MTNITFCRICASILFLFPTLTVTLFSVLFATIIPAFNFVVKILETRESDAHN